MKELIAATRRNLSHLFDFAGRETRGSFWRYVLVLYVLQMAVGSILGVITMMQLFSNPYSAFTGLFTLMIAFSVVLGLGAIILLAASVVRRLHDSGRRGWSGLLPVPFVSIGIIGFSITMTDFAAIEDGTFGLILLANFAYLGALGFLVYLLAQPGEPGQNRFGPDPRAPGGDGW